MSSTGERIRAERKAKGWSHAKLAEEVNRHTRSTGEDALTQWALAKMEGRGGKAPRTPRAIALALGVLDHWLRTGRAPKHPLELPKPRARIAAVPATASSSRKS